MIVKRYGTSVSSVTPVFQSRALTEISFRRDGDFSMPVEEFFDRYTRTEARELSAESQGDVQDEVEQAVLGSLQTQLLELSEALWPDHALVIESEPGVDYPKTRERKTTTVAAGENRLYFYRWIDPPLRVGVYRKKY
ncbi:MAG: hypothetical protein HY704_15000 [Gemmatimonadetes bacterium]|nr:hypothetical protein [Gemmatimonadota bacterium]